MANGKTTINTQAVADTPDTYKKKYEYNTDETCKYEGFAPLGATTGQSVWTIWKFTYVTGGAGNPVVSDKTTAVNISWDQRTDDSLFS